MPSFDGVDEWRNRKPPHPLAMIFAYGTVAAGVALLIYLAIVLI